MHISEKLSKYLKLSHIYSFEYYLFGEVYWLAFINRELRAYIGLFGVTVQLRTFLKFSLQF